MTDNDMDQPLSDIEWLEETLLKLHLDHPDKIQIEEKTTGKSSVLTVRVAPEDYGRVIGTEGSHIRPIREVMRVFERIRGCRINVFIDDGRGRNRKSKAA